MKRAVLALLASLGAILLVIGWRGAGRWADRGTILAAQELMVRGAPPWSMTLQVPEPAKDYLLESTVVVDSPADRSEVTAAPELRSAAVEHGGQADIQPAEAARTILGRTATTVVTHAWLRVGEAGDYRVELVNLHLKPAELTPHRWRLRLAADVPDGPAGTGLAGIGFVLLALALAGWIAWPNGSADA